MIQKQESFVLFPKKFSVTLEPFLDIITSKSITALKATSAKGDIKKKSTYFQSVIGKKKPKSMGKGSKKKKGFRKNNGKN